MICVAVVSAVLDVSVTRKGIGSHATESFVCCNILWDEYQFPPPLFDPSLSSLPLLTCISVCRISKGREGVASVLPAVSNESVALPQGPETLISRSPVAVHD